MGKKKLIFLEWINELGIDLPEDRKGVKTSFDPDLISMEEICEEQRRKEVIQKAVREALKELDDNEKELIERKYFRGETYEEISELSGRAVYKLESLHRQAIKKLRRILLPLVKRLYMIEEEDNQSKDCPICNSIYRPQIDLLIRYKSDEETWKDIIYQLKTKYKIKVSTPQVLIGHKKYH